MELMVTGDDQTEALATKPAKILVRRGAFLLQKAGKILVGDAERLRLSNCKNHSASRQDMT